MKTVESNGIIYNVIASKDFDRNGKTRQELTLKRPKGKRLYFAVVYENGVISGVV